MSKINPIIREATSKDIEGCEAVDSQMNFETHPKIFEDAIKQHRLYVAIENDCVVGYLHYGYIWEEEVAYIQMIRVHKANQRKGIGKALIHFLETTLKEENVYLLLSSTDESNNNSYKFHTTLGFQECGQLDINKDQLKEIFFKKKLN